MKNQLNSILTLLILSLLFSSCNKKTDTIKIGYLPIAECLPLYVAKEKGYFEKYGLKVDLISESGGPNVFNDLEVGAIDIGFSNVVTLVKQTNAGRDYKSIFGATYETIKNTNHSIFCRKDFSGSLDESIFGINARDNIEELMLLNYLKSKGVEINNEILKNLKVIPFPQMLSALQDKEIDLACVVEPAITIAKNDTNSFKYVGNHYEVNDTSKVLVATYVAKSSTIKLKKSDIDKFNKAMVEATIYIKENNLDARTFVLTYCKINEALLNRILLPEFSIKIDEHELMKIVDIMYNPEININSSFITKPDKRIIISDLIYSAK